MLRCKPVEVPECPSTAEQDSSEHEPDNTSALLVSDVAGIQPSPPLTAPQPDAQSDHGQRSDLWADVGPLLKFALPTLCIAVTSPLMSLADTSVVGLYSEAQLAAMSPATTVCDGIYYMMTFIPMAVTNLVALNMARKNHSAAGALLHLLLVPHVLRSTVQTHFEAQTPQAPSARNSHASHAHKVTLFVVLVHAMCLWAGATTAELRTGSIAIFDYSSSSVQEWWLARRSPFQRAFVWPYLLRCCCLRRTSLLQWAHCHLT